MPFKVKMNHKTSESIVNMARHLLNNVVNNLMLQQVYLQRCQCCK